MNVFDALTLISFLCALLALRRLRPSAFFFAGNQVIVLRALSDFQDHGRPVSQSFLPLFLFHGDRLPVAAIIFAISTVLLCVFVALPASRSSPQSEPLPALPTWLLAILGAYIVLYVLSRKTILNHAYIGVDYNFAFEFGGLHTLFMSLVLYELYRRVRTGALGSVTAFVVILVIFFATDYLNGHTGQATGYVLCGAVLFLGQGSPVPGTTDPTGAIASKPRWLALALALVASIGLAAVTRGVRGKLADEGSEAVTSFVSKAVSAGNQTPNADQSIEGQGNGTQYAAHVVECIAVYEAGHSREWRSLYNPILYTFEPSFLIDSFGVVRPIEAPWELGEYYLHLGGIFVLGEAYWNAGYLGVVVFTILMLLVGYLCDTRYQKSFVWLMLLCQGVPPSLMGAGYGFAQLSRGFINGLLVLALYYVIQWGGRRRPSPPVADAAEQAPGGDPADAAAAPSA
jgi:hypothetical protein